MLKTGQDISEKQVKKKIQNMKNEFKKKLIKKPRKKSCSTKDTVSGPNPSS
jgi:hypothetical protein